MCVGVCVCVCVRACVCACVRACVRVHASPVRVCEEEGEKCALCSQSLPVSVDVVVGG